MHVIALVPILTFFCLLALGVFMVNRKAGKVAAVKAEIEREVATILQKDRDNDQTLVENIMAGVPIDESLNRYQECRQQMFPGVDQHSATGWTRDDLEAWRRQYLDQQIEVASRGSFVPAMLAAVAVITVGTVATAVLYEFHSSAANRRATPVRRIASDFDAADRDESPSIEHTVPGPALRLNGSTSSNGIAPGTSGTVNESVSN